MPKMTQNALLLLHQQANDVSLGTPNNPGSPASRLLRICGEWLQKLDAKQTGFAISRVRSCPWPNRVSEGEQALNNCEA